MSERLNSLFKSYSCWGAELGSELKQSLARIPVLSHYSVLPPFMSCCLGALAFHSEITIVVYSVLGTVLSPWEGWTLYKNDWLVEVSRLKVTVVSCTGESFVPASE